MDYVIIPEPRFSSREGINSRCRRFDSLLFAVLAQSATAMTAHFVAGPAGRWRSIDRDRHYATFHSTDTCSRVGLRDSFFGIFGV